MIRLCEVPIIAPELRREESLLQIADAFQQLDAVASELLGRVNVRVEKQREALVDIENRVKVAQAKVDHLKGSKKAIQVFSSSKFPSTTISYEPLFKPPCQNLAINSKHQLHIKEEMKPVDSKSIKDRLHFFRVAQPTPKSRMFRPLTAEGELMECGLGPPPQDIRSAASFLIFNSSINPYRSHARVDPLEAPTRRVPEEIETVALEDAPASLGGSEIHHLLPKSYSYSPDLGAVPDLDVPVYLPDLPGVAEISFEQAMGSIAPSFLPSGDMLPELPDLGLPDIPDVYSPAPTTAPPAPSLPCAPAPPPPPAPNVPAPPPPPVPVAPPPGPPPAPSPSSPAPSDGGGGGGRDDLLAAIRGAKKNALKNVEQRKRERKEEIKKEKESGTGGGDLMGDLMAQLNRRRKGISGDKGTSSSRGGTGAMDKVSAMIPPPTPKVRSESHASSATSEDDGWD